MSPFRRGSERDAYLDEAERERIRERERFLSEERREARKERAAMLGRVLESSGLAVLFLISVVILTGFGIFWSWNYWNVHTPCGDEFFVRVSGPEAKDEIHDAHHHACDPGQRADVVRGDAGAVEMVVCRCIGNGGGP